MSAQADACIDALLRLEGGYVNNPHDRGGETNYGITLNTLRDAISLDIVPASTTIANLTRDQAATIYHALFWERLLGDTLPEPVAAAVFDAAVNSGLTWAIRQAQTILGVPVDGIVGPRTISAAHLTMPNAFVVAMADARLELYLNQHQPEFLRGWIRRLFRVIASAVTAQ